jgi:t-SNARE complex subunit (syntaxin)
MVDDIGANVHTMAGHTKAAERELRKANRWQKNARKTACWLSLILVIVLIIVLLAVLDLF